MLLSVGQGVPTRVPVSMQMEDGTVMTPSPPSSVFLSLASNKLFSGHLHQPIRIRKKSNLLKFYSFYLNH